MNKNPIQIAIFDLDYTLIKTDLLYEQSLTLIKKNPFSLFALLRKALSGKRSLKQFLSQEAPITPEDLPYNDLVIKEIQKYKSNQIPCYLVSASWQTEVEKIANHLKLFEGAFGSTEERNLKGKDKLAFIENKWKNSSWLYAGDDTRADLPLWKKSAFALTVNTPKSLEKQFQEMGKPYVTLQTRNNFFISLLKALRVQQWVKNILVFLPLILAHKALEFPLFLESILAFLLFGLCASSIYLLNDLFDLASDRHHQKKKFRPLAHGDLSIPWGVSLFFILSASSLILSYALGTAVGNILFLYFSLNILYTFKLKSVLMLDVILLAVMYDLRILFGSKITQIPASHWLLSFSIFFFLGLAFIKRCSELLKHSESSKKNNRAYKQEDREIITMLGVGCSLLSVLVFSLYLSSDTVQSLYKKQENLWLLSPLLIYWISRVWILTYRGQIEDDPVAFALKDRVTYIVGGLSLLVMVSSL